MANSAASETRRPEPPAARPNYVSPFAADSARKGTPRQEDSAAAIAPPGPRVVAAASQPEPVILGSAVPEPMVSRRDEAYFSTETVSEPAEDAQPQPEPQGASDSNQIERLQAAVLQTLADNNQRILASMLSDGEWSVQANELIIKVAESQTVVDMSLGADGKRLAIAAASGVLGRAVKLRVVPGASVTPPQKRNGAPLPIGPGGRGRAEQDPIVRRMQEKFGAQIRTVIDYREKR